MSTVVRVPAAAMISPHLKSFFIGVTFLPGQGLCAGHYRIIIKIIEMLVRREDCMYYRIFFICMFFSKWLMGMAVLS